MKADSIIYHVTATTFSIMDRVRILFGRKVYIRSEIETTTKNVECTGRTKVRTFVEPIFNRGEEALDTSDFYFTDYMVPKEKDIDGKKMALYYHDEAGREINPRRKKPRPLH